VPRQRSYRSPLSLVVSGLLTFAFVGCFSDVQSLNRAGEAGFGGEEGEGAAAGTETGATSGSAGSAGKGGGAGKGGRGSATGGSSTAGSSNGGADGGTTTGGTTTGGSGADAGGSSHGGSGTGGGAGTFGGAGSAGSSGTGGGAGTFGGAGSAGSSGAGNGGAGGSSGSAGFAGNAGAPQECDSSDGSGCNDGGTFCVDDVVDGCNPDLDSDCAGLCAVPYRTPACGGLVTPIACDVGYECLPDAASALGTDPYSICVGTGLPTCTSADECEPGFLCLDAGGQKRCLPALVDCTPAVCTDNDNPCAPGFRHSSRGDCQGPCVPVDRCACEQDSDCEGTGTCDRASGRCRLELSPAARCLVPVLETPCDPVGEAYTFINGSCEKVGCVGGPNQFKTLAECLSACLGLPLQGACPEGRQPQYACLECSPLGGCSRHGTVCVETCSDEDACTDLGTSCVAGACETLCPF
jgi:hypothetical protein